MRVLSGLMALLFLFSVAVQYNDPDPVRWMAIYGAAAVACLWRSAAARVPRWLPSVVAVTAVLWAAVSARLVDPAALPHMFDSFEMHSLAVEEARETSGLLIVTAWMLVVALAPGRPARTPNAPDEEGS
jgi:hypothetical protein